jgi:hypothetical protein
VAPQTIGKLKCEPHIFDSAVDYAVIAALAHKRMGVLSRTGFSRACGANRITTAFLDAALRRNGGLFFLKKAPRLALALVALALAALAGTRALALTGLDVLLAAAELLFLRADRPVLLWAFTGAVVARFVVRLRLLFIHLCHLRMVLALSG